jgi:hypothetical protein
MTGKIPQFGTSRWKTQISSNRIRRSTETRYASNSCVGGKAIY